MAFDSAYIAGWEDTSGDWHNTDAGDRFPSDDELATSPRIVVGVDDVDGEKHYLTTSYLTDDYGLDDFLDDADQDGDRYGEAFA